MKKYSDSGEKEGGYAGIIFLLISVALIAVFASMAMKKSFSPVSAPAGENENAIKEAEEARSLIENRNGLETNTINN